MKKNKISKNWIIKQHRDIYFKKSKIEGYRSRSAFKLIDIDKKFNFLKKNMDLLDLGAFPGGWSQVARKKIVKGKILAVDLQKMKKIFNVNFLNLDLRDNNTKEKINTFFEGKKIDAVISDMAANTSGSKNHDAIQTGELCLNAMDISLDILNHEGVFLSKLFMGSVFNEINTKAKKCFKKVAIYKPESSRKQSREIYIYCKGLLNSYTSEK